MAAHLHPGLAHLDRHWPFGALARRPAGSRGIGALFAFSSVPRDGRSAAPPGGGSPARLATGVEPPRPRQPRRVGNTALMRCHAIRCSGPDRESASSASGQGHQGIGSACVGYMVVGLEGRRPSVPVP